MHVWIIFLRGINVGGRNVVPMAELRELFERMGCARVETYIQSGNVVVQSTCSDPAILEKEFKTAFAAQFSFAPQVLLLSLKQLSAACRRNPFPEGVADPKTLHLFFLSAKPTGARHNKLADLQGKNERFELHGTTFYLHAPDGIGRSKLVSGVEKTLGVPTTARNWRTVNKVLNLAETLGKT